MRMLQKSLLAWACLQLAAPAFAAHPAPSVPATERYARRCHPHGPDRDTYPQGTMLWGTRTEGWSAQPATGERGSVLSSIDLDHALKAPPGVKALRLESGRLVPSSGTSTSVAGTVLQGASSSGKPVEVAICGAEPSGDDAQLVWYRIEAWNPVAQEWENPCAAVGGVADPRALAVGGVWDASGAHVDAPGKLTFACEKGAIAKCVRWGYQPWASRDGHSLADLHQACTRMVRADYCGDGQSHTHEDTWIDFYDSLGVSSRTVKTTPVWDPARGSFEAAWTPDGASCLARTRDGQAMELALAECPGRFEVGGQELGEGDRCAVRRKNGGGEKPLLRNRSYGKSAQASLQK